MGAKRPPLRIQEIDGSPTGYPNTLKVSNGTLTDNGDGTFTLVIGAAGVAAASGVDVTSSGTQSIPASTSTALLFDTETTDTDAYHSTVTNTSRLTVPTGLGSAFFNIAANATFAASATGTIRTISLKKNGTVIKTVDEQGIINTALGMEVAAGVYLVDGDYIEVFVYQDSVGAVNIATGATFSMVRNGGPAATGGGSGSMVLLETRTASGSSPLTFGTRNVTGQSGALVQSDCDTYIFRLRDLVPATNGVQLYIRVVISGSPVTASKYTTSGWAWIHSAQAAFGNGIASPSGQITTDNALDMVNTQAVYGEVVLINPRNASLNKNITFDIGWQENGVGQTKGSTGRGIYADGTTPAVEGLSFSFSSGNMSGTIECYGLKNA